MGISRAESGACGSEDRSFLGSMRSGEGNVGERRSCVHTCSYCSSIPDIETAL